MKIEDRGDGAIAFVSKDHEEYDILIKHETAGRITLPAISLLSYKD